MFGIDRLNDLLQFRLEIFFTAQLQNVSCFVDAALFHEPARAAWDAEEHPKKQSCRNRRDAQFPTPFRQPELHLPDHEIREVSEQYSEHNVELEEAHEAAAPLRGSDFGNIHRSEHRRAADAEAANEPESDERIPVPG